VVATLSSSSRVAVDPSLMSDTQVADELMRRRAEIDRLEAEFAELAWAGHRRGIGAADGSPSTQAWLRRHTGMRDGDARASIGAGEVCELLPRVGAAWRDGEIHSGAARTIAAARVEGHDLKLQALEDVLLMLARADDQRELRRACAHFRDCAKADGTCPRDHDGLTISAGYDGRTVIDADLSSTAAETVVNAIHALTDPPADGDTRTPARRRADALVRMAELALANVRTAGEDGPARALPACSIVIDWQTLTGESCGRIDGDYTGTLHRNDVERPLRLHGQSGRDRPRRPPRRRRPLPADDPTPNPTSVGSP
jgi:hypothetical protein